MQSSADAWHVTVRTWLRRAWASPRIVASLFAQLTNGDRVLEYVRLLARDPKMFSARLRAYFIYAGLNGADYNEWVRQFDAITDTDLAKLRAAAAALDQGPELSVIMPVHDTPEVFLRRAIESIRDQIYQNWQLCVADDFSTQPHVRRLLQEYVHNDPRIKVAYRQANGGISAASNSALALATGEYVVLVDHDDEVPPHAFLLVAQKLVERPDLDLVYSDEDKIDERGHRFGSYFKPDWNPALSLAQNFFSHLGIYRRSLIERAGKFRSEFDGSQDYDLMLRCAELTSPDRICHIPHVLYHWRATSGSTATNASAKPYATLAGQRAVQSALDRRGIKGSVAITPHNYYQVQYAVPSELPEVSILVPSACRSDLVVQCISKLLSRSTYPSYEVLLLVSDDSSKDARQRAILERASGDARVKVLAYEDRPFNFSWVNNWGARQAKGSILCFMNDDTEVITPDWLERLVARLELEGVGAVGPMLYYPDDRIQHAGVILGLGGIADHAHRMAPRLAGGYFGRAALEQDVSCITAGCAVVSRKAFDEVGGFDEQLGIAFNDVDFCIRLARKGWRILWTPSAELYHHESASLGPHNSPQRKRQFRSESQLMLDRWGSLLRSDKFYNPNLSLESGRCFALAFPPRVDWRSPRGPGSKP